MNCRPGDLAVVVRNDWTPEMVGVFVIVDRQAVAAGGVAELDGARFPINSQSWVCGAARNGGSIPSRALDGRLYQLPRRVIPDEQLRPIRPNEGEDESLSWAKPKVDELAQQ